MLLQLVDTFKHTLELILVRNHTNVLIQDVIMQQLEMDTFKYTSELILVRNHTNAPIQDAIMLLQLVVPLKYTSELILVRNHSNALIQDVIMLLQLVVPLKDISKPTTSTKSPFPLQSIPLSPHFLFCFLFTPPSSSSQCSSPFFLLQGPLLPPFQQYNTQKFFIQYFFYTFVICVHQSKGTSPQPYWLLHS